MVSQKGNCILAYMWKLLLVTAMYAELFLYSYSLPFWIPVNRIKYKQREKQGGSGSAGF